MFWIDAPLWLLSLILMGLMTITNLLSVSSFGEFEFWFAGIKVGAIVGFIVLAGLYVFGLWPDRSMNFSNLSAHGGLRPYSPGSILSAIVVVIFSMVGAEVAVMEANVNGMSTRAVDDLVTALGVDSGIGVRSRCCC